jgi:uncharacterized membrane protein YgcG
MLATTMLVMVIAVVAVLFVGLALIGRSRARTHSIAGGANDAGWSPAFYGSDGGADFSGGDAGSGGDSGCDAGGGSDGGGGCDGGSGGSD